MIAVAAVPRTVLMKRGRDRRARVGVCHQRDVSVNAVKGQKVRDFDNMFQY